MGVPEKTDEIAPVARNSSSSLEIGKVESADDSDEVFKKEEGVVDFRTVGWISTSVIFLKGIHLPSRSAKQLAVSRER